MAPAVGGRTLEETPTWAVAVVCVVLVVISISIEHIIHLIGKWLKRKRKRALFEALEKIKSELMLLGFISLLLTVGQGLITNICISEELGSTWHPCSNKQEEQKHLSSSSNQYYPSSETNDRRKLLSLIDSDDGNFRRLLAAAGTGDKCAAKGKVPFVSAEGIHELHIFIFVLAISHVLCCILIMTFGRAKVCFFRLFVRFVSVAKVDYLTLRHGFIMAHLAPQSHAYFNFHKYIKRSLEDDFKVVVGISPLIWIFAVIFVLSNTHGWYSHLWLPFIPLIITVLVGTKLLSIVTRMGLKIEERGEIVKGVPVVQPGDDLFWFDRPRLLLYLINFVLFQNAFQLAFFTWSWYEYGLKSCFHDRSLEIIIRISMAVLVQILCSYVTLPLYALVTQMGSTMKPTIFNERVAMALRNWHRKARKHIRDSRRGGSVTPTSSQRTTPSHHAYFTNFFGNWHQSSVDMSTHTSPRRSSFDIEHGDAEPSSLADLHEVDDTLSSSTHDHHNTVEEEEEEEEEEEGGMCQEPEFTDIVVKPTEQSVLQHEIEIKSDKWDPETLPPIVSQEGDRTCTSIDHANVHEGGEDGEIMPDAQSVSIMQHEIDIESVESTVGHKGLVRGKGQDYDP
ncbi:hypothetical protein CDL15_Pgr025068 [Punica granatum]|uniref:MLO-like protein n=1 Tax=Punica granatum TaxID=22663 RepID=A0A218W9J6_PUNGR|nr:hypothetical protein CDL15_Pgr025068 [Punica granatum]